MDEQKYKPETQAAQGLGWIDEATRAISPPLHLSSTYLRDVDNGYRSGREYIRADNPAFDQPEARACGARRRRGCGAVRVGHGGGDVRVPVAQAGTITCRAEGDVLGSAQLAVTCDRNGVPRSTSST